MALMLIPAKLQSLHCTEHTRQLNEGMVGWGASRVQRRTTNIASCNTSWRRHGHCVWFALGIKSGSESADDRFEQVTFSSA